jgi:hypothetical protein
MQLGLDDSFAQTRPLQAIATHLDEVIMKYGLVGVKAALDIMGFEGMRPRAPLAAVSESGRLEISTALEAAGVV